MKKLSLNDMLDQLLHELEAKKEQITLSVTNFFNNKKQYIIFLSVTNGSNRARVIHSKASSFENSWQKVTERLKRMLLMKRINPTWIKADLVTTVETVPFTTLINELAITRKNYFRK